MFKKLYNECEELFGEQIDLTEEEYKEYIEYIKSISEPVRGRTFWEIMDDFISGD